MTLVAVLGTTTSPDLFFWQAALEVEDRQRRGARPLCVTPHLAPAQFRRIRMDTVFGMGVSNLIAICIIYVTAATLHATGITDIQTSSQAAEALRPIAGRLTFVIFAAGIIGTGLLAVPVLAGSSAYALSEAFSWRLRARPPPAAGEVLLRHHRDLDSGRGRPELNLPEPRESAVLERRGKWRAGGASDGRHHADRG